MRTIAMLLCLLFMGVGCAHSSPKIDQGGGFGFEATMPASDVRPDSYPTDACEANLRAWPYCGGRWEVK